MLQDEVGLSKAFLDVAFFPLEPSQTVMQIGGENLFRRAIVIGNVVMKLWRSRRHRFERIENRRQQLVVDFDQTNRLFGGIDRLRRHRRHPIADETDLVPAQNRHIANLFADKKTFDISAGDDRAYARNFFGPRNIHAPNARMRMRAAQNLRPQ